MAVLVGGVIHPSKNTVFYWAMSVVFWLAMAFLSWVRERRISSGGAGSRMSRRSLCCLLALMVSLLLLFGLPEYILLFGIDEKTIHHFWVRLVECYFASLGLSVIIYAMKCRHIPLLMTPTAMVMFIPFAGLVWTIVSSRDTLEHYRD
jgi:hypothetical protein